MDILLALLGSGSAGSFLSIGAAANARLMKALSSPIGAATINFLVGFTVLALVLVLKLQPDKFHLLLTTPLWAYLGGLLGAIFVTLNTLIVSKLGLTTTTIVIVFSQILMSAIIDQMGWFNLESHSLTLPKISGIILLIIAIILIQLDNKSHQKTVR